MALLLDELEWGDPFVPATVDDSWEAEVKKVLGSVPDYLRRTSPIPWLRQACLEWGEYPIKEIPVRLADIGFLVVAQENSCRYCYGAARAHLRIVGFSEKQVSALERETLSAELDPKERLFVEFCRQLARSNPRPAKKERDALLNAGFSTTAVAEIAFFIADHCFHNRIATLLASPPVYGFERMGRSIFGRLLRPLLGQTNRRSLPARYRREPVPAVAFQPVVDALAGLPAAALLAHTINGAFASPVLSRRVKALMFAVVSRQLGCTLCADESRDLVIQEGFSQDEFESCVATLNSPKLDAPEARLLEWVRETVRYQPNLIQKRTQPLVEELGPEATLEAIGVAALANSIIRLATLLA